MVLVSLLGACTEPLERVRILEPERRWTGDDPDAQAGFHVLVGPFGPEAATRIVVAAPDSYAYPNPPSLPGRIYVVPPDAPSGKLWDASVRISGQEK